MNRIPLFWAALSLALLSAACSEPSFTVKGDIQGASDTPVVLEKPDFNGRWIAVDSTRTSSSGAFSMSRPAPGAPEVFRLSVEGRYVYFPVDSTETVTLSSSLAAFDTAYTLTGSAQAEQMARFDHMLAAMPSDAPADSVEAFKRRAFNEFMRDGRGSILSYYVLTKTRDGRFVFDPQADYRYYAAVATAFGHFRPDDPHTALLQQASLEAMRRRNTAQGRSRVVEGEQIALIDIKLPDEKGRDTALSQIAGKGKPTVLVFSLMNEPESPALNARLRQVAARGVEIYHISFDRDQYAWREAAANLPWTTVFDPAGPGSANLASYNVTNLPAFFVYNAQGELTDRAADLDDLNRKLR